MRLFQTPLTQLAFPVVCVVIAMVLALTSTASDGKDDPSRKLNITNSAFDHKNLAIFHAQFGDSEHLNFTVS